MTLKLSLDARFRRTKPCLWNVDPCSASLFQSLTARCMPYMHAMHTDHAFLITAVLAPKSSDSRFESNMSPVRLPLPFCFLLMSHSTRCDRCNINISTRSSMVSKCRLLQRHPPRWTTNTSGLSTPFTRNQARLQVPRSA